MNNEHGDATFSRVGLDIWRQFETFFQECECIWCGIEGGVDGRAGGGGWKVCGRVGRGCGEKECGR
jgi:hypothetical protein